jgi:hypothetical protein
MATGTVHPTGNLQQDLREVLLASFSHSCIPQVLKGEPHIIMFKKDDSGEWKPLQASLFMGALDPKDSAQKVLAPCQGIVLAEYSPHLGGAELSSKLNFFFWNL